MNKHLVCLKGMVIIFTLLVSATLGVAFAENDILQDFKSNLETIHGMKIDLDKIVVNPDFPGGILVSYSDEMTNWAIDAVYLADGKLGQVRFGSLNSKIAIEVTQSTWALDTWNETVQEGEFYRGDPGKNTVTFGVDPQSGEIRFYYSAQFGYAPEKIAWASPLRLDDLRELLGRFYQVNDMAEELTVKLRQYQAELLTLAPVEDKLDRASEEYTVMYNAYIRYDGSLRVQFPVTDIQLAAAWHLPKTKRQELINRINAALVNDPIDIEELKLLLNENVMGIEESVDSFNGIRDMFLSGIEEVRLAIRGMDEVNDMAAGFKKEIEALYGRDIDGQAINIVDITETAEGIEAMITVTEDDLSLRFKVVVKGGSITEITSENSHGVSFMDICMFIRQSVAEGMLIDTKEARIIGIGVTPAGDYEFLIEAGDLEVKCLYNDAPNDKYIITSALSRSTGVDYLAKGTEYFKEVFNGVNGLAVRAHMFPGYPQMALLFQGPKGESSIGIWVMLDSKGGAYCTDDRDGRTLPDKALSIRKEVADGLKIDINEVQINGMDVMASGEYIFYVDMADGEYSFTYIWSADGSGIRLESVRNNISGLHASVIYENIRMVNGYDHLMPMRIIDSENGGILVYMNYSFIPGDDPAGPNHIELTGLYYPGGATLRILGAVDPLKLATGGYCIPEMLLARNAVREMLNIDPSGIAIGEVVQGPEDTYRISVKPDGAGFPESIIVTVKDGAIEDINNDEKYGVSFPEKCLFIREQVAAGLSIGIDKVSINGIGMTAAGDYELLADANDLEVKCLYNDAPNDRYIITSALSRSTGVDYLAKGTDYFKEVFNGVNGLAVRAHMFAGTDQMALIFQGPKGESPIGIWVVLDSKGGAYCTDDRDGRTMPDKALSIRKEVADGLMMDIKEVYINGMNVKYGGDHEFLVDAGEYSFVYIWPGDGSGIRMVEAFNNRTGKDLLSKAVEALSDVFNPTSYVLSYWGSGEGCMGFAFRLPDGPGVKLNVSVETGELMPNFSEMVNVVMAARNEVAQSMGDEIADVHVDGAAEEYDHEAGVYVVTKLTITAKEYVFTYVDKKDGQGMRIEAVYNKNTGLELLGKAIEQLKNLMNPTSYELSYWGTGEGCMGFAFMLPDGPKVKLNINAETGELMPDLDNMASVIMGVREEVAKLAEIDISLTHVDGAVENYDDVTRLYVVSNLTITTDKYIFTYEIAQDGSGMRLVERVDRPAPLSQVNAGKEALAALLRSPNGAEDIVFIGTDPDNALKLKYQYAQVTVYLKVIPEEGTYTKNIKYRVDFPAGMRESIEAAYASAIVRLEDVTYWGITGMNGDLSEDLWIPGYSVTINAEKGAIVYNCGIRNDMTVDREASNYVFTRPENAEDSVILTFKGEEIMAWGRIRLLPLTLSDKETGKTLVSFRHVFDNSGAVAWTIAEYYQGENVILTRSEKGAIDPVDIGRLGENCAYALLAIEKMAYNTHPDLSSFELLNVKEEGDNVIVSLRMSLGRDSVFGTFSVSKISLVVTPADNYPDLKYGIDYVYDETGRVTITRLTTPQGEELTIIGKLEPLVLVRGEYPVSKILEARRVLAEELSQNASSINIGEVWEFGGRTLVSLVPTAISIGSNLIVGVKDTPSEDTDGDGKLDASEDLDGDWKLDVNEDLDGDGNLDIDEQALAAAEFSTWTVNGRFDVDNDGRMDINEDIDGDGHLDLYEDLDDDGILDIEEDVNGDDVLNGPGIKAEILDPSVLSRAIKIARERAKSLNIELGKIQKIETIGQDEVHICYDSDLGDVITNVRLDGNGLAILARFDLRLNGMNRTIYFEEVNGKMLAQGIADSSSNKTLVKLKYQYFSNTGEIYLTELIFRDGKRLVFHGEVDPFALARGEYPLDAIKVALRKVAETIGHTDASTIQIKAWSDNNGEFDLELVTTENAAHMNFAVKITKSDNGGYEVVFPDKMIEAIDRTRGLCLWQVLDPVRVHDIRIRESEAYVWWETKYGDKDVNLTVTYDIAHDTGLVDLIASIDAKGLLNAYDFMNTLLAAYGPFGAVPGTRLYTLINTINQTDAYGNELGAEEYKEKLLAAAGAFGDRDLVVREMSVIVTDAKLFNYNAVITYEQHESGRLVPDRIEDGHGNVLVSFSYEMVEKWDKENNAYVWDMITTVTFNNASPYADPCDSGPITVAGVPEGIMNLVTNKLTDTWLFWVFARNEVDDLYQSYFLREPNVEMVSYWVDAARERGLTRLLSDLGTGLDNIRSLAGVSARGEDIDGDGNLDIDEQALAAAEFSTWTANGRFDADNDGNMDNNEDIDGDGHLDAMNEDIDGDRNFDTGEDTNHNGVLDPGEDIDGDGVLDLSEDLDGDGNLDIDEQALAASVFSTWTANGKFDVDNDGITDSNEDIDADGHLDAVNEDIDGDLHFDSGEYAQPNAGWPCTDRDALMIVAHFSDIMDKGARDLSGDNIVDNCDLTISGLVYELAIHYRDSLSADMLRIFDADMNGAVERTDADLAALKIAYGDGRTLGKIKEFADILAEDPLGGLDKERAGEIYDLAIKYSSILDESVLAKLDRDGDRCITEADKERFISVIDRAVEEIALVREGTSRISADQLDLNGDGGVDMYDYNNAQMVRKYAEVYFNYLDEETAALLTANPLNVVLERIKMALAGIRTVVDYVKKMTDVLSGVNGDIASVVGENGFIDKLYELAIRYEGYLPRESFQALNRDGNTVLDITDKEAVIAEINSMAGQRDAKKSFDVTRADGTKETYTMATVGESTKTLITQKVNTDGTYVVFETYHKGTGTDNLSLKYSSVDNKLLAQYKKYSNGRVSGALYTDPDEFGNVYYHFANEDYYSTSEKDAPFVGRIDMIQRASADEAGAISYKIYYKGDSGVARSVYAYSKLSFSGTVYMYEYDENNKLVKVKDFLNNKELEIGAADMATSSAQLDKKKDMVQQVMEDEMNAMKTVQNILVKNKASENLKAQLMNVKSKEGI
ncbi:MAG: hypothetical protein HQL30_02960 [Candidatus Omnitrophica bacterium]|nr:hypothetical protein [Candidatus Omnitrophota bacterium]